MTAQFLHTDAVSAHGAGGPLDRLRLRCALFIAGAAVMILQIVGTRIIGPHFGAGLSVWTALIDAQSPVDVMDGSDREAFRVSRWQSMSAVARHSLAWE